MAPLLARFGQRVDALPDPPGGPVPVDALDPGGDPKRRGSVDRLRYVSGVDEHLGRDAPTVQAGAAKLVLLDHGNRPASVVRARDRITGACPNNNQVELLHHTPPALHCVEKSSPGALTPRLQQCHWRAYGESPALDHGTPSRQGARKEAQEPPAPASAAPLGFAAPTEWSDTPCAASPWRVSNCAPPPNGSYLAALPAHVR